MPDLDNGALSTEDEPILRNDAKTVTLGGEAVAVAELPYKWSSRWRAEAVRRGMLNAILDIVRLVQEASTAGGMQNVDIASISLDTVKYVLASSMDDVAELTELWLQMAAVAAHEAPPVSVDEFMQDRDPGIPDAATDAEIMAAFTMIAGKAYPFVSGITGVAKT